MSLALDQIHHGDARQLLREVEPESIACAIWSPPYHVGKAYERDQSFTEWQSLLQEVIRLHTPLLKPGGFLVVNIADILAFPDPEMPRIQALNPKKQRFTLTSEQILAVKAEHPDWNRHQLARHFGCSEQTIDRRLNGNNIRGGKYQSQTRVYLVGHGVEQAALAAGLYLYDRRVWVKDPCWENSKWHTLSYRAVDEFEYLYIFWKPGITTVDRHRLSAQEWGEWGSRAVWNIRSVKNNRDHEAKFPLELPQRLIQLLTDEGDTVLDCFIGSGTTAVAAIGQHRHYLGIELDENYVELARKHCREAARLAASLKPLKDVPTRAGDAKPRKGAASQSAPELVSSAYPARLFPE